MRRSLSIFLLFLALAIIQTSFFASLPGLLAYTPLVAASGVYLVQHVGERYGAFWIASFGVFLDILSIPSFPLETFPYVTAGLAAYLSARHLFSNRSWYGLIACGAFTLLSLGLVRAFILVAISLRHPETVSWMAFWDTLLWNAVLSTVLLTAFFGFAGRIRSFLRTGFLASNGHEI
ncbi:hypothetical protein A2348_02445 [Candidatus Uhrbacteria bacterium RIFOXYB12_FULL_58_10]|uniref:Rod shape-determining protein MreD n=1 Tax=Candidatus Uhrbacteria bacterium RIFOXYB2_FULL_57_15 TaxID=1802422 RepID=A0A1F7W7W6_9BACT|nr:MAG: hypothetical protein A2348_02445 [Candidatus Uhrbacteria bacterium RIFOXYB12_FULL_58_10]OGL98184.1 MAG: hypothetical protein A2304_03675 [Candidatus Uhrbacteria bacterium RIFOXYB2_FULL_57_15]OGL99326.1 MAG: hypothetical protein A2501_05290 [Candidatus Uhrbacteria bacterium RIFOXYC12_FULL_57_11]